MEEKRKATFSSSCIVIGDQQTMFSCGWFLVVSRVECSVLDARVVHAHVWNGRIVIFA
jgi:hypothetical protein